MHCAIRNKNLKRNKICLTNTEGTCRLWMRDVFWSKNWVNMNVGISTSAVGQIWHLTETKTRDTVCRASISTNSYSLQYCIIDCRSTKTKTQTWEKLQPTIVKATGWISCENWKRLAKSTMLMNSWSSIRTLTPGKHQEKPASVSMILQPPLYR